MKPLLLSLFSIHLLITQVKAQQQAHYIVRNYTGTWNFASVSVSGENVFGGQTNSRIFHWKLGNSTYLQEYSPSASYGSAQGLIVYNDILFAGWRNSMIYQFRIGAAIPLDGKFTDSAPNRGPVIYGDQMFSAHDNGFIQQWNVTTFTKIGGFLAHSSFVSDLAISGDFLFSAGNDRRVRQWLLSNGSMISEFMAITPLFAIAVAGDSVFAAGANPFQIYQWSLKTGLIINTYSGHSGNVHSLVISDDSLFSASADFTIKQWNTTSNTLIRNIIGHGNTAVNQITIGGMFLFSAANDRTVKQWFIPELNVTRPEVNVTTTSTVAATATLKNNPNNNPPPTISVTQTIVIVVSFILGCLLGFGAVICIGKSGIKILQNATKQKANGGLPGYMSYQGSQIIRPFSQNQLVLTRPLSQTLVVARPLSQTILIQARSQTSPRVSSPLAGNARNTAGISFTQMPADMMMYGSSDIVRAPISEVKNEIKFANPPISTVATNQPAYVPSVFSADP